MENDRADIKELTEGLDQSKYMIVIDHQPNDYKNEQNRQQTWFFRDIHTEVIYGRQVMWDLLQRQMTEYMERKQEIIRIL